MGKQNAVANPIGIQGYKFTNQVFFEPQIELLSLEGISIIVLRRMILNESMLQSLWRSNLAAFVLNSRQQLLLLHPTPPHHPICCVASTMCASSTMLLHPTPPPHLLCSIDHVCKFNDAITPHPTPRMCVFHHGRLRAVVRGPSGPTTCSIP